MGLATLVLAASLAGASSAPHAASREFDVRVSVRTHCARGATPGDCARRITADVFRRRDGAHLQRLRGPFPARGIASDDILRIADFDFDGHDDIALCSGADALGGAPSYAFHLYRPETGRFIADTRLAALQSRASGFFVVDQAQRRLRLEAHGGSGRTMSEYAWQSGRPVMMRRTSADAIDADRMRLVLGERRHGHWREQRWTVRADAEWPAAFEAAEAALRKGR